MADYSYPTANLAVIADRVAEKMGCSKLQAEAYARAVFEAVKAELISPLNTGGTVKIRDSFTISRRARRGVKVGTNIRKVFISFKFTPSESLRREVLEHNKEALEWMEGSEIESDNDPDTSGGEE
jgi:nucleoid DNA-binding protein